MKLPLIPLDKANHFIYGSLIALAALFAVSPLPALMVVAAAAIGKEIADQFSHGTPDPIDALVTVVGGLVPILANVLAN